MASLMSDSDPRFREGALTEIIVELGDDDCFGGDEGGERGAVVMGFRCRSFREVPVTRYARSYSPFA